MAGSPDQHLRPRPIVAEPAAARRSEVSRAVNRFGLMLIGPALLAAVVIPVLIATLGGGGGVLRAVLPLPVAGGVLAAVVAVMAALASRWIAARRPAGRLVTAIRITGWVAAGLLGLSNAVIPVVTVVGEGTAGAGAANAAFVLLLVTWMGVLILSESIAHIWPREPGRA